MRGEGPPGPVSGEGRDPRSERGALQVHCLVRGDILAVRGEGPPSPLSGEGTDPRSEKRGASKSGV